MRRLWFKDILKFHIYFAFYLFISISYSFGCEIKNYREDIVVDVNDNGTLILSKGKELRLADLLFPIPPVGFRKSLDWKPWQLSLSFLRKSVIGKNIVFVLPKFYRDRYGRLIAHVYLKKGNHFEWLQKSIVREGLARVYSNHVTGGHCLLDLINTEQMSRSLNKGLWANQYYRIHKSSALQVLLNKVHEFVIVEGLVHDASEKKGHLYLNFGNNWKSDFTVKVSRKYWKQMKKAGYLLSGYQKKYMRVRGWLVLNNGPILYINNSKHIEVLTDAAHKKTP